MALEIHAIPCLADNYAWLLLDRAGHRAAVVDVPAAAPIMAELAALDDAPAWRLTDILITHHHDDHIAGVAELRAATGARVIGAAADANRLPPLDLAVTPGAALEVLGEGVAVLDVPGHTIGHLAYYLPQSGAVFTGDSLMALGCGRLFEGTPDQMWASLVRLAALPPATLVCSGHEYAAGNARFALTVEPGNPDLQARAAAITAARAAGRPTVPVTLLDELVTNPFLRVGIPAIQATLGLTGAAPATIFAELRARKDRF